MEDCFYFLSTLEKSMWIWSTLSTTKITKGREEAQQVTSSPRTLLNNVIWHYMKPPKAQSCYSSLQSHLV